MPKIKEIIANEVSLKQYLNLQGKFIDQDYINILTIAKTDLYDRSLTYKLFDEWNKLELSVSKGSKAMRLDIPYFHMGQLTRRKVNFFNERQIEGHYKSNILDYIRSSKTFFHETIDSDLAVKIIEVVNNNNYNFKVEVGHPSLFNGNTPFLLKDSDECLYLYNPNSKGATLIRGLLHLMCVYSTKSYDIPDVFFKNGYIKLNDSRSATIMIATLYVLNKALYLNLEDKLEFDSLMHLLSDSSDIDCSNILESIGVIAQNVYFKLVDDLNNLTYNFQEKEDLGVREDIRWYKTY